eukprot:747182-Hanusia_phi.AAC.2
MYVAGTDVVRSPRELPVQPLAACTYLPVLDPLARRGLTSSCSLLEGSTATKRLLATELWPKEWAAGR